MMDHQAWLVLTEGFLSFFSPCVIPVLPVYMAYLSREAQRKSLSGWRRRLHVFGFTLAFVLGICTVFVIAAASAEGIAGWLSDQRLLISLIGGILILFFGLVQLGWIQIPLLMREFRLPFRRTSQQAAGIVEAWLTGFLFSFAWTPCIGPMLSSVLVMAAASSQSTWLIGCYGLGFVIPFLILGCFTEEALRWLDRKKRFLPWAVRIGGILLVVMGLWMSVSAASSISAQLQNQQTATAQQDAQTEPEVDENGRQIIPAYDFTLTDQYGQTHTLSDYKGKVVFLQFFATWCGYCKAELPYVQQIYEDLPEDVVILVVNQPGGRETSREGVIEFLEEQGYTFPVVFDEDGSVNAGYGITGLPTTYLINQQGNIYGYMPGAMDKETMLQVIDMARNNEPY